MRVAAKFLFREFDNVRIAPRKFPTLEVVLNEINPENSPGDKYGFETIACHNKTGLGEEAPRLRLSADATGLGGVAQRERFNRPVALVNAQQERF
jgi:hypothetical protein